MKRYRPLCLDVAQRPVVVIGGGGVGTQKVRDLLECDAQVTVISPETSDYIRERASEGRVTLQLRRYKAGDTDGAFLVIVATDDPEANAAVYAEANAAGRMVNVCDDPPHCNFIFASKIERGPLTVSLFTHGTSPAFARRVRREMEGWLGPEYAQMAELMAQVRIRVRALDGLTQPQRQRIYERLVYSELLLLFREGEAEKTAELAERLINDELSAMGYDGQR